MNEKIMDCGYGLMSYDGHFGKYQRTRDGDVLFFPKGTDLALLAICKKMEDDTYFLKLEFQTISGCLETIAISRADMMQSSFCELLSSKGACIDSKSIEILQVYINMLCEKYKGKIAHIHSTLGWAEYQIQAACGSVMMQYYKHYNAVGKIESDYTGNWAVRPNGSWELWKGMVLRDVLPYAGLSTALLIGLSSVVFGLIHEEALLGNPIFSLSGNSSSGKTTAAMLAASVAFAPIMGKKDFKNWLNVTVHGRGGILSWAATANGLLGRLGGLNGVPIVMDEISRARISNFDEIVYALHDGVEKDRMKQDTSMRNAEPFHAPVLSIGEVRLSDRCSDAPDGVRTRIFEFGGELTKDAEHSRRIKAACQKNYALAAPKFAEYLLQQTTKAEILEIYEREWRAFAALAPKTKFSERRAQQFAGLLLTTAKLAQKGLGLDFNISKITDYLIACETEQASEGEDIASRAYSDVIAWVNSHPANFSAEAAPYAEKFGRIFMGADIPQRHKAPDNLAREVAIRVPALEAFLRKRNYQNVRLILSTWRDRGLLNCEFGKLYRKRTISTTQEHLYILREFQEVPSEDDLAVADEIKTKAPINTAAGYSRQIFAQVIKDASELDSMDDIA